MAGYQEVRFLDKVTLLYRESYTAEKLAWEHLNTWQWPYFMSCEKVESEHLWLSTATGAASTLS